MMAKQRREMLPRRFAKPLKLLAVRKVAGGTTLNVLRFSSWLRGLDNPLSPQPLRGHGSPLNRSMKIERFAGHHEAKDALVLSVAGVTAIMLIESLVLLILY